MRAIVVVAMLGLGLAGAPGRAWAQAVPVAVTDARLLVVPVHVNGEGPFSFLVDTGSTRSLVATQVATRAALEVHAGARVRTSTGDRDAGQAWLDHLHVGPLRLSNHPVVVTELDGLGDARTRVDGILGLDVLRQADYTLDVAARTLTFHPAAAAERLGVRVPFAWSGGRMVVTTDEPDPRRLVVDSGASALVWFGGGGAREGVAVTTAGAPGIAMPRPSERLRVGGLDVAAPHVVQLASVPRGEHGLLPLQLFARVTVDHQAGELVVDVW